MYKGSSIGGNCNFVDGFITNQCIVINDTSFKYECNIDTDTVMYKSYLNNNCSGGADFQRDATMNSHFNCMASQNKCNKALWTQKCNESLYSLSVVTNECVNGYMYQCTDDDLIQYTYDNQICNTNVHGSLNFMHVFGNFTSCDYTVECKTATPTQSPTLLPVATTITTTTVVGEDSSGDDGNEGNKIVPYITFCLLLFFVCLFCNI
eukprot:139832_1